MILVFSHESPIAVFGNMANTTIEIQTLYVVDILTLAFLRFCVRSICSRDSGCDTVHLCRDLNIISVPSLECLKLQIRSNKN